VQLAVHGEVEAQSSEVQSKELLGCIIDPRMGGSEGVLYLLDAGQYLWGVEVDAAVAQLDQLHVEHLDGLQPLDDGIEDQANAILRQVDDNVHAQGIGVGVQDLYSLDDAHLRLDDSDGLREVHAQHEFPGIAAQGVLRQDLQVEHFACFTNDLCLLLFCAR